MKTYLKRFICLALIFVMVCGIVPMAKVEAEAAESWLWPVSGYTNWTTYQNHRGIDVPAPSGTPIRAAKSGTLYVYNNTCNGSHLGASPACTVAGCNSDTGKCVFIIHGDGTASCYMHLVSLAVTYTKWVNQGDIIGYVGTTGPSTGNHLHFEAASGSGSNYWSYSLMNPGNLSYIYSTTVSTTGISLNTNSTTVDIGETVKLTATVSPSNATNKTVTWSSNDTSVATVSGGTVKGIKPGVVTITAKSSGGQTATCKVVVFPSTATPTSVTEYNGHLYELYDYTSSWKDAKEFCEAKGGHLVTITSKAENDVIYNLAQKGNKARYCLGATDETTESNWLWVTGENFSYSNFQSGENTDSTDYEAEDYLFMYTNNGQWGDVRNYAWDPTVNGFICEYDKKLTYDNVTVIGDKVYELYKREYPINEASRIAKSKGGYLVSLTSASEQTALIEWIQENSDILYISIGANDLTTEGSWQWSSGEKWSYTSWVSGEPNDTNGIEDNAILILSSGKWNDVTGANAYSFVIEYDLDTWINLGNNKADIGITDIPDGADPDDYEKVTEYRYRDKQTTTSTASSMSGWTLYDSDVTYGSWSSTKTTNTKPTVSDTLQITGTSTKYKYYHYWNYYGGCNCIDSISYGTNKGYCEIYLTYQLGAVSMEDQGGKQAYGSYTCGNEGFNYWFYGGTVTTYSYQTRTKTTTNHFYKYGDWSAWGTTPVTATSNRQVETRTVYKLKDHKHKSSSWIIDKKATVNATGKKHKECTECGKVLETAKIKQLKCSKPTLKTISNTTSGVKITWGKVSGADSYRVYRKTKNGSWKYLSSTSKTYYTDKSAKSGTKYYYTVRAENEAGLSTYNSTGLSIKRLANPKLSKTANTTSGVKITWSEVSGASGYIVYRKTSGGSWKQLGKTTKTYYTDKKAKSGTTYYYTVRAYSGSVKSYYNTDGLKIKFLSTPKISSVKNTTTGIKVGWNKISGAKGYVIYRKTGSGDWKQIGKVTSGKTVTFTDKNYNNNTTYKYTVRAFNGRYKSSYYANKASIKAVIKGDITSSNVKSVFLPTLKQISAANNQYAAVGLVEGKNGMPKDYRGKVPTSLPDYVVLGIYKFKSVNSISELKTFLKKYMSTDYMEENCYFDMLTEYKGSLYVIHGARGSTAYDANSIKLVGRHGKGYYISADSYGSGDNYFETVTFYVKKVNGRYVVDDIVSKKQLYDWDYTSSNYKPV